VNRARNGRWPQVAVSGNSPGESVAVWTDKRIWARYLITVVLFPHALVGLTVFAPCSALSCGLVHSRSIEPIILELAAHRTTPLSPRSAHAVQGICGAFSILVLDINKTVPERPHKKSAVPSPRLAEGRRHGLRAHIASGARLVPPMHIVAPIRHPIRPKRQLLRLLPRQPQRLMLIIRPQRIHRPERLILRPPDDPLLGAGLEDRGSQVVGESPGGRSRGIHLGDRVTVPPDVFVGDRGMGVGRHLGLGQEVQLRGVEEELPTPGGDGRESATLELSGRSLRAGSGRRHGDPGLPGCRLREQPAPSSITATIVP